MTDLDIRRPDPGPYKSPYRLGDRYRTGSGRVLLTGVQAIARALIEQHERDARAGLRVATFVSGGFILIQGSVAQIDALRRDPDFEVWLNRVQLVADQVGVVDAWVGDGIAEAIALYEKALESLD